MPLSKTYKVLHEGSVKLFRIIDNSPIKDQLQSAIQHAKATFEIAENLVNTIHELEKHLEICKTEAITQKIELLKSTLTELLNDSMKYTIKNEIAGKAKFCLTEQDHDFKNRTPIHNVNIRLIPVIRESKPFFIHKLAKDEQ